jgi:hypothetical protein
MSISTVPQITSPPDNLITIEQAAAWCKSSFEPDDPLIGMARTFAMGLANKFCQRELRLRNHTEYVSIVPESIPAIRVKNAPIISSPGLTAAESVELWMTGLPELVEVQWLPKTQYTVDANTGIVRSYSGFIPGYRTIKVVYAAGYDMDTVPSELQLGILQTTAWIVSQRANDGMSSEKMTDWGATYLKRVSGLPEDIASLLSRFRRHSVA